MPRKVKQNVAATNQLTKLADYFYFTEAINYLDHQSNYENSVKQYLFVMLLIYSTGNKRDYVLQGTRTGTSLSVGLLYYSFRRYSTIMLTLQIVIPCENI